MRFLGYLNTVRRNASGSDLQPRMLTWTVTFKCNARCEMCDSWKIRSANDLKPDEADRIFSQFPRMDIVRLTGGEPFVRKDFPELVEIATRRLDPLALQITTNGFQSETIEAFCAQRDPRVPLYLLVSIDGVEGKHDQVRGIAGAWDRCLETLERLAPHRREWNLRLAVNQTIVDREGIDHFPRLRERLAHLGVRNQMVLAYDESATYSVDRGRSIEQTNAFQPYGTFSQEDLEELVGLVEQDLQNHPFRERIAKRYYLDGLRSRVLAEGKGPSPKCVALHNHLRLFPNGDVPTCQFNSHIVGNLRDQSFEEVWQSATATEQRAWVRKCSGCWAECEVLPSAIYTGDLWRHSLRRRRSAEPEPHLV